MYVIDVPVVTDDTHDISFSHSAIQVANNYLVTQLVQIDLCLQRNPGCFKYYFILPVNQS